jgi:hypothetical protein
MIKSERVTNFKLTVGNEPVKLTVLVRALNDHLDSIKLDVDRHAFVAESDPQGNPRIPGDNRTLIVFVTQGTNEGYFVSLGAIDHRTKMYTELAAAKTELLENAYLIARETHRFIVSTEWNACW